MFQTFLATLLPMLTLFLCIAVGYTLNKCKLVPDSAGKVMAKLENWVFCPALSFATLTRFCTVETIGTNAVNVSFSLLFLAISISVAIPCSKLFVPQKAYERGIYQYALAFGNLSYMGDPIALALFGDMGLSYYKMFTLPLIIVIYTWGINGLIPEEQKSKNLFKNLLNPTMIASFIGILLGLSGLGGENGVIDKNLPFLMNAVDSLKTSMGPMAMLLAGFTIASYDMKKMLKNKKVYVATFLRLIVLPVLLIGGTVAVRNAVNGLGGHISTDVIFLSFLAAAMPLGLNTIVFAEAYGGNTETGASMATISHSLCIITIPILYAIMTALFGAPQF